MKLSKFSGVMLVLVFLSLNQLATAQTARSSITAKTILLKWAAAIGVAGRAKLG